MQPPKLPPASAWLSSALEIGSPRDQKSVLGYCQKGESTKSQEIQACFPDWKQLSFMALCKNTFSLLALGPYQESWNSISLLPTCSGHRRAKFYNEGRSWILLQMDTAQPDPALGGVGGWQDHFLNAERHIPAGCFFKLADTPSEARNSYSFLKINRDHIPQWKASLGSPEVYSPPTIRCFAFSGEAMILWE